MDVLLRLGDARSRPTTKTKLEEMDIIPTAEQPVPNLPQLLLFPACSWLCYNKQTQRQMSTVPLLSCLNHSDGLGGSLRESHRICWPMRLKIRIGNCSKREFWNGFYLKKEKSVGMKSWKAFQVAVSLLTIITQAVSRELVGACHFPFQPNYRNGWDRLLSQGLWRRGRSLQRTCLLAGLCCFTEFNSNLGPFLGLKLSENLAMCTDREHRLPYSGRGKGERKGSSVPAHSLL